jgi:CubicO group peptidase (beta-lactamase class C family)
MSGGTGDDVCRFITREIDGVRLVHAGPPPTITTIMTTSPDRVLGAPVAKCLGYFSRLPEFGGHPGAFGCKGSGGSIAFADPSHEMTFAFTHNRMAAPPEDPATSIAEYVRDALTAARWSALGASASRL